MRKPMSVATLVGVQDPGPPGLAMDGLLLAAFATRRDEVAFAALVRRHGPLVWAVAARHAAERQAAEDAFQATFLALAHVAGRLDPARPLAGWLHTVAVRFARKTRRFGRRHRVGPVPESTAPRTPLDELTGRELLAAIDIEVARLPERYRLPVLLCCLQDLTRDEAAARLGWSAGVLKGRLERGRDLLRRRLAARGLTLPAALAGPLLAPLMVAPDLRAATIQAAVRFAVGPVPGTAAALAERMARRVSLAGRGWVAVAVVSAVAVGLTVAGLRGPAPPAEPGPRPREVPAAAAHPVSILPDGALRTFGDQRFRHPGGISGSALSPDGKRLATAAWYSVILWDATTGEPLWRADAGTGGLFGHQPLVYSPDGSLLVLVRTNYALVWDVATGRLLKRIRDPRVTDEWITSTFDPTATFTPDGKHLVLGRVDPFPKDERQRHTTEYHDTSTWVVTRSHPGIAPACFCPVGPTVIGFDPDRNLVFSDPATGRQLARPKTQAGASWPTLAPDGKALAVRLRNSGTVELWSVPGGELMRSFPSAAPKDPMDCQPLFTADGKTLLVPRPSDIARLDLATGKVLDPIPLRANRVGLEPPTLHLLPDGDTLLVCADDGLVHRWSLATRKELPPPDGYANWAHTAISPDGRWLAINRSDGRIDLWDLTNSERTVVARESTKQVTALAFPREGRSLAVGRMGGEVEVRDLPGGQVRAAFITTADRQDRRYVRALCFSPDGRALVVNNGNYHLEAWDAATGKQLWTRGSAEATAISPDGKTLIAALAGPHLVVCDPATGQTRRGVKLAGELNERMGGEIPSLAFAPDGRRLFVATRDQRVRICDPVTVEERASFVTSELRPTAIGPWKTGAEAMAVSPDGQWLLTGGDDRTVRQWEVATRAEVRRFVGHDQAVRTVGFGPGGRTAVSAGRDGAVYQWDLRPRDVDSISPATWVDLGAAEPAVAYRAIWSLAADAAAAAKLLRAKLPPATAPDPKRLAGLIGRLGADEFADREAATRELADLGRLAEPALRAAVARGLPAEARARADRLLKALAGESVGEELRQSRAVQALALAGGTDATALQKEWAAGAPGALLTEQSRSALSRSAAR